MNEFELTHCAHCGRLKMCMKVDGEWLCRECAAW